MILGQSGGVGSGVASEVPDAAWHTTGVTHGTAAWDKFKRDNCNDITLVDDARPNDVHGFKPLGPGWSGGDSTENPHYMWEEAGTDPGFGLEMQLAHAAKRQYRRKVYIVKYAIGGSQLFSRDGIQSWNVDRLTAGGNLCMLEIAMEAYWAPALARIVEIHGGLDKIRIGGVVDWIGFTDAKQQDWADAFDASQRARIDHIRGIMLPSNPTGVPWCQIKTWRARMQDPDGEPGDMVTAGYIDEIREHQDGLVDKQNVFVVDSVNLVPGPDGLHPNSHSNSVIGQRAFTTLSSIIAPLAG